MPTLAVFSPGARLSRALGVRSPRPAGVSTDSYPSHTAEYVPARGAVISVAPVRPACKESISSCTAAISVLISWLEV